MAFPIKIYWKLFIKLHQFSKKLCLINVLVLVYVYVKWAGNSNCLTFWWWFWFAWLQILQFGFVPKNRWSNKNQWKLMLCLATAHQRYSEKRYNLEFPVGRALLGAQASNCRHFPICDHSLRLTKAKLRP